MSADRCCLLQVEPRTRSRSAAAVVVTMLAVTELHQYLHQSRQLVAAVAEVIPVLLKARVKMAGQVAVVALSVQPLLLLEQELQDKATMAALVQSLPTIRVVVVVVLAL
jgi:hypothetical protein